MLSQQSLKSSLGQILKKTKQNFGSRSDLAQWSVEEILLCLVFKFALLDLTNALCVGGL